VTGEKGTKAMIHALKTGYLLLDSAKFYENEEEVGEAVRSSGLPREKIFVVSKLFSTSGGRKTAIEAVEESLKQMDIGYIDQYLLHAPQGGRVLECYDVFLEYQKKGLIKTVGVSNFGVEHLEAMKNSGRPLPQVNQIELHPWCTQEAIVDWCKKNGVVVVGYSPFAKNNRLKDPVVLEVAKKYGRTPAQILIRYSLQKGFVTIPKSSDHKRIEDNAKVFDFSLTQEDMDRFDAIGRKTVSRCSWNPTTNSIPTEFGPTK
jgi:diketogulonate reductase-like aldo/keto reductase